MTGLGNPHRALALQPGRLHAYSIDGHQFMCVVANASPVVIASALCHQAAVDSNDKKRFEIKEDSGQARVGKHPVPENVLAAFLCRFLSELCRATR